MSSKGIVEARKQLKNAFLASYIFGAAVLTFFLWGVEPGETASRFWALTCSLVPMGLYIGYGRSLSPKHRDDAGFADSVYYLGFMFTLTSLFLAINVIKDNAVYVEEQIFQVKLVEPFHLL